MRLRFIYLPIMALFFFIVACDKNKFQTKPTLKIKTISSSIVPQGGNLTIEFEYTDKEGDISDTIFVKKTRINTRKVTTVRDSFGLSIPSFPDKSKGFIQLALDHQNHLISAASPPSQGGNPPKFEPDSIIMKFCLQDKAKNKSDTVTTGLIVVLR